MKFKKGMLEVGRTLRSPDGPLSITVERLRHWRDTFHRFRSLGLKVPVFFGHQDDPKKAVPVKRLPEDSAGKLIDMELSADGRKAEFTIDVPRPEDASKVEHNLVELSPVIFENWTDGDGTEYKDCITDVDLVVHPVDHRQEDFQPVVACSIRMGLDKGKPVIYRLASDDDDEDSEHNSDHDSDDEAGGDGDDRVKRVIEGMAALNIIVPDDTTVENFFERVESALLTAAAMGDGGVGTESLEATSPEFAAFSLKMGKFQSKQHQTGVLSRLDSLLKRGQCTPVEYKDRKPQVGTISLSLNDNGEHQSTAIESWIESREEIPVGSFWDAEKHTRMSNVSDLEAVPHPDGLAGDEVTEEKATEIVDEMFA